jgi:hypothetical protein
MIDEPDIEFEDPPAIGWMRYNDDFLISGKDMKPILIVPANGNSTRFGDSKLPKWALEHPSGRLMIAEAVRGISGYSEIHIAIRDEYRDTPIVSKLMMDISEVCPDESYSGRRQIHFLKPTASVVETVSNVLNAIGGDFPFVSKDCDNYFTLSASNYDEMFTNFVAYANIRETPCPEGKCYLDGYMMPGGGYLVTSLKEKREMSPEFCCGAYGFRSSKEFQEAQAYLNFFRTSMGCQDSEMYLSDVMNELIRKGKTCYARPVLSYSDWGTRNLWERFLKEYKK